MKMGSGRGSALALVLVAAATGLYAPCALQAQGRGVPGAGRPQGWVGLALEVREAWRGEGRPAAPVVVITDVHPGSPAARARIEAGDTLLSVNDEDASPAALARLQSTLDPGRPVSFTLLRNGHVRTVSVQAGSRPADEVLAALSPELRDRLDSAHAVFLRHLTLVRQAPPSSTDPWGVGAWTWSSPVYASFDGVLELGLDIPDPAFAPPLPSLLFRDAQSAVLERRLQALEREMRAARVAEGRRLRELARAKATLARLDLNDAELRRQRERQDEIWSDADAVKQQLERLARNALELQLELAASPPAAGQRRRAQEQEQPRPLAPYIVGRDWLAGARLTPVSAELGAYFGVERGLLVVEIADGTPASDAGLVPGDVILRAGDREVFTLDELRAALTAPGSARPLLVALVRKGAPLRLTLSR